MGHHQVALESVLETAAHDQDFVLSIESRQTTGLIERVEQVVLVGRQVDDRAGAVLGDAFGAPFFFADDKHAILAAAHQCDDHLVATGLQHLCVQVRAADRFRGLFQRQALDLDRLDQR
jgi:hypothetical protein